MVVEKYIEDFIEEVNNSKMITKGNRFNHRFSEGDIHMYMDGLDTTVAVLKDGLSVFFNTVYTFDADKYNKETQTLYIAHTFQSIGGIVQSLPRFTRRDTQTVLNLIMAKTNTTDHTYEIKWKGYKFHVTIKGGLMVMSIVRVDKEDSFWYNVEEEEEVSVDGE